MRKALAISFFILTSQLCRSQIAVQYSPVDFIHYTPAASQIAITPLWNYSPDGGTNIVHSGPRKFSTGTIIDANGRTLPGIPGTLIVSNTFVASGGSAYRVEFFLDNPVKPVATFTNVFTNGTPNFVNAADHFGVSTNATVGSQYAYTIDQVNNLFANFSGGAGISLSAATNVLNGAGGVIVTNGTASTFKFSTTGTNAIKDIGDVRYDAIGNATVATNGYPWGALYDAVNSALNATNGIGIGSGLSAFVNTNRFASSNVATASVPGIVKVDNSTITATADGTLSAVSGGSGNVTGSASSTDSTFALFQGTGGKTLTNRDSVGTYSPSSFASSATTITFNGTANQITSSAGAQDLSANITWTLSLPSTLIIPGTVKHVGSVSNEVDVSTTGTTTNFGDVYAKGAATITGGMSNLSLTASTLLQADANKKVVSIPNGAGALTNDASGNFGYAPLLNASTLVASQYAATDGSTNLVSTQNGNNWTNTIPYTHEGTGTNLTITFNGTRQTFTMTNGPTQFYHFAGANGSACIQIPTNITPHFDYNLTGWLGGTSNSVVTNGCLIITSMGGTNDSQLLEAIVEK